MTTDSKRTCQYCKHAGWDPDGPYCAQPQVLKKSPYGLLLSCQEITKHCPAPEKPLWEEDTRRRFT